MSHQFRVGQDVVCIHAGFKICIGKNVPVEKGRIYRIAELCMLSELDTPFVVQPDLLLLRFQEIGGLFWYSHDNFRPVKKTSIDLFRNLIAPVLPKERVNV